MLDIHKIFLFDSVGPLCMNKHNPGIVIQTQIKHFLAVSSMQQQKDGKCIICSEMGELVLALVLGQLISTELAASNERQFYDKFQQEYFYISQLCLPHFPLLKLSRADSMFE